MSSAASAGESVAPRVLVGRLGRVRRGKRTAFEDVVPEPEVGPQPDRMALTLALAHAVQGAIDRGEIRDQVGAARKLGITRARMSQLLATTLLAPQVQEAILGGAGVDSRRFTARSLRGVVRYDLWARQVAVLLADREPSKTWSPPRGRGGPPAAEVRPSGTAASQGDDTGPTS